MCADAVSLGCLQEMERSVYAGLRGEVGEVCQEHVDHRTYIAASRALGSLPVQRCLER